MQRNKAYTIVVTSSNFSTQQTGTKFNAVYDTLNKNKEKYLIFLGISIANCRRNILLTTPIAVKWQYLTVIERHSHSTTRLSNGLLLFTIIIILPILTMTHFTYISILARF